MDKPGDHESPAPLGGRQALRLLLPAFVASAVLILVGLLFIVAHHHTIGFTLVIIGALGGFVVRARIMIRQQMDRRPPSSDR